MSPRRDSARLPSNFGVPITSLREVSGPPLREHLLGQMKVTKAKALNTSHLAVALRLQSSADDEPGVSTRLIAACSSLAFLDAT